jgi:ferredoxin
MLSRFNLANTVLVGMAQAVSVHAERCNRLCHKSATCNLCETNCPAGAIKVGTVGSNIQVDWTKCTYCGICINICPTGTFGVREKSYTGFLNTYVDKITEQGLLKLACKKIDKDDIKKDGEPPVLMECLGMVGLTDILYFYTHGAKQIQLNFPDCADCVNKYGKDIVMDEVDELKRLVDYFEYLQGTEILINDTRITLKFPQKYEKPATEAEQKKVANEQEVVSRRAMFQLLRKNATDTALRSAALLTPQNLPDKTPFRKDKILPVKRRIFIDSLVALGKLLKTEMPVGAYFYNQSIARNCKYCKICVRFCHSGALAANAAEGDSCANITFNASL